MTKEGIYEFIARQKTSIISSVGEDGYPATRALIQPLLIDGNDIYFATYTSSRKVAHYRANSKACVYFLEKGRNFSGVEIQKPLLRRSICVTKNLNFIQSTLPT